MHLQSDITSKLIALDPIYQSQRRIAIPIHLFAELDMNLQFSLHNKSGVMNDIGGRILGNQVSSFARTAFMTDAVLLTRGKLPMKRTFTSFALNSVMLAMLGPPALDCVSYMLLASQQT
jgi:hypothetical protein